MENNQQRGSEKNTSNDQQSTTGSGRPGQQLPTVKNSEDAVQGKATQHEQHSESSLPENDNETLGTP